MKIWQRIDSVKEKVNGVIFALFVGSLFSFLTTSCIYDKYADLEDESYPDQGLEKRPTDPFVMLKISTLAGGSYAAGTPLEMIKTLRIIMLSDDKVELNEVIRFDGTEEDHDMFLGDGALASDFAYIFTRKTIAGEKKFYLVANEESVGEISLCPPPGITLNYSLKEGESLTSLLNSFPKEGENTNEFSDIINSVSFAPDYKADVNNNIYLPYTSYYEGFKIEIKEDNKGVYADYIDRPMYLVPVATKINFEFTNYKKSAVEIEGLKLLRVNKTNYLHAQLMSPDYEKTFDDNNYYWIDWLEKISEESQKYQEIDNNLNFNTRYGWISSYLMPEDDLSEYNLIDNTEIIPVGANQNTPGFRAMGPYYIPEAKNLKAPDDDNNNLTEQSYSIKYIMHDKDSEFRPNLEPLVIDNLKSLFRNTHLTIYVKLYEGEIEIFAEIIDWNPVTFEGYLQEQ